MCYKQGYYAANVKIQGKEEKNPSFSLEIWNKKHIFAEHLRLSGSRRTATGRNTYSFLHPGNGTQTEYKVELKLL